MILILLTTACGQREEVAPAQQLTPSTLSLPTQKPTKTTLPSNEMKLEANLQGQVQADPQQHFEVIVQFFEEPSLADQKKLEELLEVSAYSFGPVNFAEGTAIAKDIEKIALLTFVKWIEEQPVNQIGE